MKPIVEIFIPRTKEGKRIILFQTVPLPGKRDEAKNLLETYIDHYINQEGMPKDYTKFYEDQDEFTILIVEG